MLAAWQSACLAAFGVLLLLPANQAAALSLQLTSATSSENTFDLTLTVGGADRSDSSTGAGNVEVELDHEIVNGDAVVTGIAFTGGQIDFSDISFAFALNILRIHGSNIAGTTDSLILPSPVVEGAFDATDHQLTVNQGTFVSSGLANQTIDISEMPFGGPGSGDGSVQITETSRTSQSVTYDATVLLPVAFVGRVLETPIAVDVEMSGNILASGAWTVDLPLGGDYSGDGVIDAIDYAVWRENLDAPAGTLPNDVDGGPIGSAQYATWRANFGAAPAPAVSSGQSAAPEPAAALLLILGSGALLLLRAKRAG